VTAYGEPPVGDSPELETRERQSLLVLLVLLEGVTIFLIW